MTGLGVSIVWTVVKVCQIEWVNVNVMEGQDSLDPLVRLDQRITNNLKR
jgi:hypothetical protein